LVIVRDVPVAVSVSSPVVSETDTEIEAVNSPVTVTLACTVPVRKDHRVNPRIVLFQQNADMFARRDPIVSTSATLLPFDVAQGE
jgi:hypothetical protein